MGVERKKDGHCQAVAIDRRGRDNVPNECAALRDCLAKIHVFNSLVQIRRQSRPARHILTTTSVNDTFATRDWQNCQSAWLYPEPPGTARSPALIRIE
jgi:hypothetical protein